MVLYAFFGSSFTMFDANLFIINLLQRLATHWSCAWSSLSCIGKTNARRQGIGYKKTKMERCEIVWVVKVKTTRGGKS